MTFSIFMNTQTLCLLNLGSLNYTILSFIITQYLCMHDFHNDSLPETFNTFFFPVNQRHIAIIPDLLQDHRSPLPIF
jgi:hypothetical protein